MITMFSSPDVLAMRLTLSFADGNREALKDALNDFATVLCPGCRDGVVMALVDTLVYALDMGFEDWQLAMAAQLASALDAELKPT